MTIHALAAPTFPELGGVSLPLKGYWLTFSPDSRYAYAALADGGEVAVIDASARRVVRRLAAGRAPKRNLVLRGARD